MQQRELKFRGWDTVAKEWCYGYETLGGFNLIGEVVLMGELGRYPLEHLLNNIIFTEFTGLKDSMGTDIYEGDLIELGGAGSRYIYEVRYEDGKFVGYHWLNKDWGKWGDIHRLSEMDFSKYTHKVIGNIFQNPELITTT